MDINSHLNEVTIKPLDTLATDYFVFESINTIDHPTVASAHTPPLYTLQNSIKLAIEHITLLGDQASLINQLEDARSVNKDTYLVMSPIFKSIGSSPKLSLESYTTDDSKVNYDSTLVMAKMEYAATQQTSDGYNTAIKVSIDDILNDRGNRAAQLTEIVGLVSTIITNTEVIGYLTNNTNTIILGGADRLDSFNVSNTSISDITDMPYLAYPELQTLFKLLYASIKDSQFNTMYHASKNQITPDTLVAVYPEAMASITSTTLKDLVEWIVGGGLPGYLQNVEAALINKLTILSKGISNGDLDEIGESIVYMATYHYKLMQSLSLFNDLLHQLDEVLK